jgi:chromosome segregation ATPase
MNIKCILTGILVLFLQTACAVSDDPRQGGLMGYWHGTSSGRYEERQQEKLRQLEEQKKTKQRLSEESAKLNSEVAIQDRKLAEVQAENLRLEKDLAILNANIDKLQIKSEKQRQQVAKLKIQVEEAQQRINKQKTALVALNTKGGSASDPDQVQTLQYERDRLADEYRKLNVYYQALANAAY